MTMNELMEKIKRHPDIEKAGMILCHNGVVRKTSREGKEVSGLRISVDHKKLEAIISEHKKKTGIIEILVEINEEMDLSVGDDVMYLIVAGDIRDNVIPVLNHTLNEIKETVTSKTQFFV